MARRLRVQHGIACQEARVEPPVGVNNLYNLFRVGYTLTAPADTEFPWVFTRLDLFARFVAGRGDAEFEIEVVWSDAPEGHRNVGFYGPFPVVFRSGEPTRDLVFRLQNVTFAGLGRYRVVLRAVRPRRRKPLATEFLTVEREP